MNAAQKTTLTALCILLAGLVAALAIVMGYAVLDSFMAAIANWGMP